MGGLVKAAVLAAVSLIMACPSDVAAQAQDEPHRPPPPLFPKHRRGLYRSGEGPPVLDATPQSPPLEIDDPGVPEKGEYEVNLTTEGDFSKGVNYFDLFRVDANYGLEYKVFGYELPTQLKFEVPVAGSKVEGRPFASGVGAFKAGVKLNVFNNEHNGTSVSFYPQVEFSGPTDAVRKGLAEAGQTVLLPLLLAREFSAMTVVMNGAVHQPLHDPDRASTASVSVGVGRAVTRHFVLMTEARLESAFDFDRDRLVALNIGLMRSVGEKLVVYGNAGRSVFSDDRTAHAYLGCGLKVVTDANKKAAP